jgi:hypothetical protein
VVVTGSPRVDPDRALRPASQDERDEVRRELRVEDGDRLLVISAARNPVGDEIHSVNMVARVLDGPLPGVHVVVKLHPEAEGGEHYEALRPVLASPAATRRDPSASSGTSTSTGCWDRRRTYRPVRPS